MSLESLTQHAHTTNATITAERARQVEAIREALRETYLNARQNLPTMEQQIKTIYRPFLIWFDTYNAGSLTPIPQWVVNHRTDIDRLCETSVFQVRTGIAEYEGLTYRQLTLEDGQTLAVNKPGEWTDRLRFLLSSYDGALDEPARKMKLILDYLHGREQRSGPEQGGDMVPESLPVLSGGIPVKTEFKL